MQDDLVEVLVFPLVFVPCSNHGQTWRNGRTSIVPLVIPAMLHKDGALQPHRSQAAWIPRNRLVPVAHDEPTFGELVQADRFAAEHSDVPTTWAEAMRYAETLIETLTGLPLEDLQIDGFMRATEARIQLAESGTEKIVGSILRLYDLLEDDAPETAVHGLLRHAGVGANQMPSASEQRLLALTAKHWATVSDRHPLAPSQRLVLAQLIALSPNEVLAVQGPPGTGKTTLLKSAVAQLWVAAAVEGQPCPLIAACSANNQAVTNIIDAFASDDVGDGDPWAKRWLPGVRSLGLYAKSADTAARDRPTKGSYQTLIADQQGLSGFFRDYETLESLEKAESAYLNEARVVFGADASTPEKARERLLAELRQTTAMIERVLAALSRIIGACPYEPSASPEHAIERRSRALREAVAEAQRTQTELASHSTALDSSLRAWTEHIAKESIWQLLLSWIPAIRARRDAGRRLVLRSCAAGTESWPVSEQGAIDAHLGSLRDAAHAQLTEAAARASNAAGELTAWEASMSEFDGLAAQLVADHSKHPPVAKLLSSLAAGGRQWPAAAIERDGANLNQLLDITLRVRAFRLATHYWEAAYLIELRALLAKKDTPDMDQPDVREAAFRRWAKVAPCMVSTFFMLPKFLTPWPRGPQPMHGAIDLLVCDEAGQVPPEKAAASFALARRALVVGDVLQIEPVWSVSLAVDAANAAEATLIPERDARRDWSLPARKAVSASAGNLMSLAQQVTPVRQSADGEGGLFLSEHRRCVPEIVAYCNSVYNGRLVPMRSSIDPATRVLPALGYAALPFRAEPRGGGWRNPGEASLIVSWLQQRRAELESHYSKQEKRKVSIGEIVAVLTPFRSQKEELLEALEQCFGSEHGITAGTVHALQGAERPVVILSPVYDASMAGPYFFDHGPNMLNVAVSRAQDSFLVFGCLEPFEPRLETPAGRLGRELFGAHGSEITDLPLLQAEAAKVGASLVIGEQPHNELLRRTVQNARRRLVVSSPFLTRPGLEARGVLRELAVAVGRGVEIEVMVDYGFTVGNPERRSSFAEARALLLDLGVLVRVSEPDRGIHAKTLIADTDLIAEGSFNWFAAVAEGNRYSRHETSLLYQGEHASRLIEESLGALRSRLSPRTDERR